uniref:Uncharacterized protein n=1 Tax=Arundo donax TaxID=35708 RepID=A0A0A9CA09_ARUDO
MFRCYSITLMKGLCTIRD